MEIKQPLASEKEATASVLPKRKASEPFLIPWQDETPFKLSREYILQFYEDKRNIKKLKVYGEFNEFYSFEEFSMSVKTGAKEKYTLYFTVTKSHLLVRCSCNHSVKKLCEHAAAVLYHKTPSYSPFYFKYLHNEKLLAVPKKFRGMLNVVLARSYNGPQLELRNSATYGHVYNLNISGNYNWNAWHYRPIVYRGIKNLQTEFTPIEFLVVANKVSSLGLPYILPYVAKSKTGRNLSKSYLFYEGEERQNLSPADLFKEKISRRMIEIANDDSYQYGEGIDFDEDRHNSYFNSMQGVLAEWRKLIASLQEEETLCFASLSSYKSEPKYAKLNDTHDKRNMTVSLAQGGVCCVIHVDDNPSFVRLSFQLSCHGQIIDHPKFLGDTHCFFLEVPERHIVFIDDLDLERVLRYARQADYILTVLDRDRTTFLQESMVPLLQRYACQVDHKGKKGLAVLQTKKPNRIVKVRVAGEYLHVEAAVDYGDFGVHPLAPNANILVNQEVESGRYRYASRYSEDERLFYDFLQQQHRTWAGQQHESLFTLPLERIDHTQWLAKFVHGCKAEGVTVQLDEIQLGSSFYPHPLRWEVRQVRFENNKCSILFAPMFRSKVIPLEEFEDMVMNHPKVYTLGKNQYGVIQSTDIALFKPVFLSSEIDGDFLVLNTVHMISLQHNLEKINPKIINDSIRERRERLAKLEEIPQLQVPATVQATLRPYQQAGFSWLAFLNEFQWGGLLADDMGLGKTLQVITLLEHFYSTQTNAAASLVVLPNSLLFNWQSEYQKFAPTRQVALYHGTDRHQYQDFDEGCIVLTTYGTMLSSIDFFKDKFFSYLIMDESQNVKNRNSKRFESLAQISANYRIAMTGTPIENGIQDIYAQMSLVNPGFFGNYRAFNKLYKVKVEDVTVTETLSSLQKMIQPFLLRRTKKQVALDLPDKTETVLHIDMLPAQRKIYNKYRKLFRDEVEEMLENEDASKSKFIALEALIKLRQICNSPSLLKEQRFAKEAVKLDYIDEILEDVAPAHKVLLFSSFTGMLQLVAQRIEAKGVQYAYLDGKLSQQQRQAAVEQFQNEENCRLFLISLKAGGTGLNLTAADYVYILDPWWNPAAEAQAIDRCYRIGQDKHVNAYKLVCRDSVEEKIMALQEQKKKLANGLILDETNIMKSLSKEELLKLFE